MERVSAVEISTIFSPARHFPTVADLVNVIVINAFMFAGVICFLFLVFGGFSVIMGAGGGDTKQLEKGKQTITGAVIGLIIVLVSVWIIQILEHITGQPILNTGL